MILLRSLSVPAFKHLRDVELAFPRAGSVLIEGPNESGKSTLFEAIYFALYGAPLSNGGGSQAERQAEMSLAGLVPHNGAAASVGLTLRTDGAELEIHRTLTRQQAAADGPSIGSVTQDARLIVRRTGARPEEVSGERAVNARIVSALRGLDGEALRNSCFVEQRALDRVEALSRAAREEAIAKLLGLERLVGIERDLTPGAQDHAQVEQARIEMNIAERNRDATEAEAREAEAGVALRAARARALVAQQDGLAEQHGEHERQGQALRERSGELEGRIARAGQVAALLATLDAMEQDLSAGRESEVTAAHLRATLADLDRIEREQLPAGQARVAELRDLEARLVAAEQARADLQHAQQLQRVAELDERLGQLDALIPALDDYETAQRNLALTHEAHRLARNEESARAAVMQYEAALTQAQMDARDAQTAVDSANLRDILAYWLRLKEIQELRRGEHEVAKITQQRDKLALRVVRLRQREVVESVLAMIGALTAGGAVLAYMRRLVTQPFPIVLIAAVAVMLVWLIGVLFLATMVAGRRAERTLRECERRLNLASIRTEAANLLGGSVEDLPQVEADLRSAGAAVPSDLQIGRTQLASLVAAEPGQLVDLEETARQVMLRAERSRVELASAQAQLETARRERAERDLMRDVPLAEIEARLATTEQIAAAAEATARAVVVAPFSWPVERATVQATNSELAAQRAHAASGLGISGDETVSLEQARAAVDDAQTRLQMYAGNVEPRLAALGLPADAPTVAAARGAAETEVTRWQEYVGNRDGLAAQIAAADEHAANTRVALSPAVAQAWAGAGALGLLASTAQPGEHADLNAVAQDRATVQQAASAHLQQLDERAHRDELAGVRAQLAAHDDRTVTLVQQREALQGQVRSLLGEQGIAVRGDEPLDQLTAAWPLLGQIGPDEVEQREQALAAASREAHFTRRTADDLARTHGYDPAQLSALDLDESRRRHQEAERMLRQRELATSMARDVRARLVRRVLPECEAYMRELLPALTLGRYRDVRLESVETDQGSSSGADLRMHVWDEVAGAYVDKSIFSGGAQDQASLALRLAFALATLPKELGARPGFIFLDEPLSAFDAERSQALVQALTHGLIAQQFAQIFLISHSPSIDSHSFRYAVRMRDGAVEETTLPEPREAVRQWEGELVPASATVGMP